MALNRSMQFNLAHTYRGISFDQRLPIRTTILSYLDAHAQWHGDDPFITAVSTLDQTVTLSYRQLDVYSRRLAEWLRGEAQVGRGDIVALLPANDIQSVVAIFGLLRSGCSILFLNPNDPVGRWQQQMEALGVLVVLYAPALAVTDHLLPNAIAIPDPSTLRHEASIWHDVPIDPSADALFFGTSGSTAASKLVAQSHYSAAVNAAGICRHHQLQPGQRFLGCLPIYHVNGLHFTIFGTLASGAHAILAQNFEPFSYPHLIERFRPRIASVVPSILEALLGTWRRPSLPQEFCYFVSAAAPLTASTARALAQKMNTRILQGYGLTETINFSTTMPIDLSEEAYRRLMLDAEIPSIGIAIYGNEVMVRTASGNQTAPGEIGEICMRGHNIMMGYANNPDATAEAFQDGWFHSQDLGFEIKDEAGRSFYVITGRTKNIAKVRGESVSLDEMDRVLRSLPTVQDAACVSLAHRFLGDEIIAAVVCPESVSDIDVRNHLRTVFAPSVLPNRIVRLEAIPRTPTGKIRRATLTQDLALLGKGETNP